MDYRSNLDTMRTAYLLGRDAIVFPDLGRVTITGVSDGVVSCDLLPNREAIASTLLTAAHYMTSQQYGPFLEKKFGYMFGFESVNNSRHSGDYKCETLGYVESKCSIPSAGSRKFSVQQVRPAHECSYYLLSFYEAAHDFLFFGFVPKPAVMALIGSPSHGKSTQEFGLRALSLDKNGKMNANLASISRYNFYPQ